MVASSVVESVRESRMSRLRSSVHRASPMPAPARFTTASTPSNTLASMRPSAGCHSISSAEAAERTTGTGVWPPPASAPLSAVPISPVDPVMATFITSVSSVV